MFTDEFTDEHGHIDWWQVTLWAGIFASAASVAAFCYVGYGTISRENKARRMETISCAVRISPTRPTTIDADKVRQLIYDGKCNL